MGQKTAPPRGVAYQLIILFSWGNGNWIVVSKGTPQAVFETITFLPKFLFKPLYCSRFVQNPAVTNKSVNRHFVRNTPMILPCGLSVLIKCQCASDWESLLIENVNQFALAYN